MPDRRQDDVDVTKLYEMLKSAEQQREVGNRVIKALIIDILRSKLGNTSSIAPSPSIINLPWHRGPSWLDAWADSWYRTWTDSWSDSILARGRFENVLQQLVGDVTLSDEERRILEELEKEDVAKDAEKDKDK